MTFLSPFLFNFCSQLLVELVNLVIIERFLNSTSSNIRSPGSLLDIVQIEVHRFLSHLTALVLLRKAGFDAYSWLISVLAKPGCYTWC
jgi:hypothetical protein